MPRGASPKREREYKEIKSKFKHSGRYKGREEEVAARIVNKQRSRSGESKKGKSRTKSRAKPRTTARTKSRTTSRSRSRARSSR